MKTTTTTTRWAIHTIDGVTNTETRATPDLYDTIADAKAVLSDEIAWQRSTKAGAKGTEGHCQWLIVPETKALTWETDAKCKMAATLSNYRHNYEPHLTPAGKKSLSNGDAIAKALAAATPEEVIRMAEDLLQLSAGSLLVKYQNLNAGQQRMNAGNRIRSAFKRGEITVDENGNLHRVN